MPTDAYRRHLARARAALQAAVGAVLADVPVDVVRRPALDAAVRLARVEVAEAVGRYPAPCAAGFDEALARLVDEATEDLARPGRLDLDALGIMDDQRVQEEVEVVDAGRVLADEAGGPLHRLHRLEAALRAQLDWRGPSPVGPAAIGRALWRATERLPLSLAARSEAVRCAVRLLGARLGPVYTALVEVAQAEEGIGIAVEAPRERAPRHAPAPATVPSPAAADANRAAATRHAGADRAVRPAPRQGGSIRERLVPDGEWASAGTPFPPLFDVTRPGALAELAAAQPEAVATPAPAPAPAPTEPMPLEGTGEKIPQLIHRHREALSGLEAAAGPSAAVHSLIGRIFDEIVADPALERAGADWIGRLQPAVLRLAASDAELLQSHRHPAWTLVNQLATLFAEGAGRRPPNLDEWLERVTAKLRADPRRERFESFDAKLASWRAERARRRLTEVEPVVDLLRRHASLEADVDAARRRLERRLDASRADEAVRRYVASVWALVCAQEGAGAPPPAGQPDAWDTATDLIWSASPARSRLDSPTLLPMIPSLVERLKAGMGRLGLDAPVQDAWLERLASLHLKALQRAPEEAQTDMPLTIDLALEEVLPPAETPAPAALDVVLAGLGAATATAAATIAPTDPVDALGLGETMAMLIQGAWLDVALIWRSDNGHFLLFERPDGHTLSITRRSLDRLLDAGVARLPDAGGALARAARRIADSGFADAAIAPPGPAGALDAA